MSSLATISNRITTMSVEAIDNVRKLEHISKEAPQVDIDTLHVLHGGMYSRTVKIPAGTMITGALIKIPTILVASGDFIVYIDGGAKEMHGYNVLAASANRKQAFVAVSDTYLTMTFPSNAKTVKEAEEQFTDEFDMLSSRTGNGDNSVIITEE